MSDRNFICNDETELLMLHRVLLEAKFNPCVSDNHLPGSPYVANIARRILKKVIEVQSQENSSKSKKWASWLENKKQWIWGRSLSYMLKNTPYKWDDMEYEIKYNYISDLFSPYQPSKDDVAEFILEYERYRKLNNTSGINIKGFGRATDEMIAVFEHKFNRKLPEDYKQFLYQFNGGTVLVHFAIILIKEIDEVVPLEALLGLNVEKKYCLINRNALEDEYPKNHILIGMVGGGGRLLLDEENSIFYWRSKFDLDSSQSYVLYKIADNFSDFMKGLKKFNSNLNLI